MKVFKNKIFTARLLQQRGFVSMVILILQRHKTYQDSWVCRVCMTK